MRKISIFIFCLFIYSHLSIGQEEQQYAGTAMPYPFLENSSYLVQDGMVPFYIYCCPIKLPNSRDRLLDC